MSDPADILYREAAPFERALAHAAAGDLPVPIRELLDANATPLRFLPFKAAHESVDLWFDDWPTERKRLMARAAEDGIAALKGARGAFAAFLPFVDAEIVDRVAHPRRFVLGRSALGIQPIGHQPFTSHLLVRVPLKRPVGGLLIGRSPVGRTALRTPDREPIRRLARALVVAKAPETLVTFNTGHRRPVTIDDGFPLDGSFRLGGYLDRKRL